MQSLRYIPVIALLLCACKKSFLEVKPKGVVIAQSISDYDKLVSDPLSLGYTFVDAQVAMGDEVTSIDPYYTAMPLRTARLFRWEDEITQPDEDARDVNVMMQRLYQFNKVANEVMDAKDGTEEQKKAIYAEARANWAFINLYMINLYGKPYNPATAASDPGFPIIRNADVTNISFTRATVKEVYDLMVNDLVAAIPNLPVGQFTRARINKSGAEMLLGKIYLYMGKFDQALVQFNNAVNDLPQGNSLTPMALYDYNTTLAPAGPWSYNPATSPNTYLFGYPQNLVNTENLLVRQFTNNWSHFSNDLLLNTSTYALYGANDTRKRLYSTKAYSGSSTLQPGVYRKIAPQFANLGLNLPDLYLMRAECKARTGDIGGAKDDLEMLTTKRMPVLEASVPSGLTQEQMIRFVLDERLREFAMLGYRWFDMRRLSVDPLFSSNTYSHQYLKSDGSVGATFVLRPERLTLRFPAKLLAQNPGMPNNP